MNATSTPIEIDYAAQRNGFALLAVHAMGQHQEYRRQSRRIDRDKQRHERVDKDVEIGQGKGAPLKGGQGMRLEIIDHISDPGLPGKPNDDALCIGLARARGLKARWLRCSTARRDWATA